MFKLQDTKSRFVWGILFLLGIILTACGQKAKPDEGPAITLNQGLEQSQRLPHAVGVNPPGGAMMLSGNTKAGDALGDMLLPKVGSSSSILLTTMVDMEDFEKSSAFGRASMQQVGSRLSQHGFRVIEPDIGANLRFERRQGVFMLTRETMKLLHDNHDAHAAMVGTYSESKDKVFLSVRVVRLQDSAILGAYEYYLPKNEDVEALLGVTRVPGGNHLWGRYVAREPAFVPPIRK